MLPYCLPYLIGLVLYLSLGAVKYYYRQHSASQIDDDTLTIRKPTVCSTIAIQKKILPMLIPQPKALTLLSFPFLSLPWPQIQPHLGESYEQAYVCTYGEVSAWGKQVETTRTGDGYRGARITAPKIRNPCSHHCLFKHTPSMCCKCTATVCGILQLPIGGKASRTCCPRKNQ
jgi:hypothetical protein